MRKSALSEIFLVLGFAISMATQSFAQGPDIGSVSIGSFNYGGNACPAGTVAADISPDAQALTLLFGDWVTSSDESPTPVISKSCQINLRLDAPAGWRYAILGLDYRGYANLEEGVDAQLTANYRFNGGMVGNLKPLQLVGPFENDYINSTAIELSALPWSSCGGDMTLQINSAAQLTRLSVSTDQQIYLTSGDRRYTEQDLGLPIKSMRLLHKDSAAPCVLNRSFGFRDTKAWVDKGCRARFQVQVDAPLPDSAPRGLITVDSINGQLTQNYGIAWQQCAPGRWVQAQGLGARCEAVCRNAGLKSGRDSGGAACASGEARPASAIGRINFSQGCWGGGCTSMGNLPTSEAPGGLCFAPGQKKDGDKTDRTVGCFCY